MELGWNLLASASRSPSALPPYQTGRLPQTQSVSPHRCCTESAAPSFVCSELTPAWRHFLPHCYPPTSLPLSDFRPGSVTMQLCSFPSAYSRTDRPMSYRASTKAGGGVGGSTLLCTVLGDLAAAGTTKTQ